MSRHAPHVLLGFVLPGVFLSSCGRAQSSAYERDVTIWYDAFNTNDPALVDKILDVNWQDIPPAPGQAPGRQGAKDILAELTKAFPDLELTVKDVMGDGDKVIVRSEITGTQAEAFMGFASKNRRITIQAIDIHQFADGKIVRTWHTEDWNTAFRQMGAFEQ